MKIKPILCTMTALAMMSGLASCQSGEDVMMPDTVIPGVDLSKCETVSFSINLPSSELKTRAGETPSMTYGDDGLFSFTRTIDKLWYAVYNNGTLLYSSFDAGINQGVYKPEDQTFVLDIQIPKVDEQIKLNEYAVFFFAGNAADKVVNREITDGIGLDFANKTMYAYPSLLNKSVASGEMFNPEQYDFFAKYTTLDKVVDSEYNGSVTLIRPFCQVSLLTDELCQPAVLSTYATDYKVSVTTTPAVYTKKGATTTQTLPYAWNFDSDKILTKELPEVTFSLNSRAFNNAENAYTIPQEVTFKNRKMFCVASYLMLAPSERKSYMENTSVEKFRFLLTAGGDRNSTDASVSARIPTGGLKANEKYIMYNRKHNPDGSTGDPTDPDDKDPDPDPDPDPDDNNGGIFSSHFVIDVVVDPTWEGNKNIVF